MSNLCGFEMPKNIVVTFFGHRLHVSDDSQLKTIYL